MTPVMVGKWNGLLPGFTRLRTQIISHSYMTIYANRQIDPRKKQTNKKNTNQNWFIDWDHPQYPSNILFSWWNSSYLPSWLHRGLHLGSAEKTLLTGHLKQAAGEKGFPLRGTKWIQQLQLQYLIIDIHIN